MTECRSILWLERADFNGIFTIKNRVHLVLHENYAISDGRWMIHCLDPAQCLRLFDIILLSGKNTALRAGHHVSFNFPAIKMANFI
jgi:hypothetical protein